MFRALDGGQLRTSAALANFLIGGWLGPVLRLVALGAALRRGGGHGGQPAAQLLGGEFSDHEIAERGENVHGAAADEIADRLALVPLVVNVAGHRLPHRELDDLAIAAAGLISGLATTARALAAA
jgi:hypothetical protein